MLSSQTVYVLKPLHVLFERFKMAAGDTSVGSTLVRNLGSDLLDLLVIQKHALEWIVG
jgi:hypothetical protein